MGLKVSRCLILPPRGFLSLGMSFFMRLSFHSFLLHILLPLIPQLPYLIFFLPQILTLIPYLLLPPLLLIPIPPFTPITDSTSVLTTPISPPPTSPSSIPDITSTHSLDSNLHHSADPIPDHISNSIPPPIPTSLPASIPASVPDSIPASIPSLRKSTRISKTPTYLQDYKCSNVVHDQFAHSNSTIKSGSSSSMSGPKYPLSDYIILLVFPLLMPIFVP